LTWAIQPGRIHLCFSRHVRRADTVLGCFLGIFIQIAVALVFKSLREQGIRAAFTSASSQKRFTVRERSKRRQHSAISV
jgi:hypothetical protein